MAQISSTNREDQKQEFLDLSPSSIIIPTLTAPKVSIVFQEISQDLCPICDTILNEVNQIIIPECFHKFCNSCITTYITVHVQDSQVSKIPCPQHTCKAEIPSDIANAVLTPELFEKYKKIKKIEELNKNPNLRWCPTTDCEGYDIGSMKKQRLTCNICNYNYCYYCSESWHENNACKAQTDYFFDKWSKENGVKFCPSCTRRVQNTGGCDHVVCAICNYKWCWLCGEKYHPTHYDICKVRQMKKKNPKWSLIFLMIFCIPITPFLVYAAFLTLRPEDDSPKRKHRITEILIDLCTFIFILIFTPLIYVCAIYVITLDCLNKISELLTKKLIVKIINGFIAIPFIPIIVCVGVAFLIITTIAGFFAIIIKIIFIIRRSCNPDYMGPTDYVAF